MFDIVVCSMNNDLMDKNIKVINSVLMNFDLDYHIFTFNGCCQKLIDIINDYKKKIYIIDIDDNLDIAFKIRENDFRSIIILISSHNFVDNELLNERLMILDYVRNSKIFLDRLKQDICLSMKIMLKGNIFTFMYNHVLYRIPYEDINYIEKE